MLNGRMEYTYHTTNVCIFDGRLLRGLKDQVSGKRKAQQRSLRLSATSFDLARPGIAPSMICGNFITMNKREYLRKVTC